MVFFGKAWLERALTHYHEERNHQGLQNRLFRTADEHHSAEALLLAIHASIARSRRNLIRSVTLATAVAADRREPTARFLFAYVLILSIIAASVERLPSIGKKVLR